MFIFSQFNFPDPKPQVSKGDLQSPRGSWGWGVGRDQLLPKNQTRKGGSPKGGEAGTKGGLWTGAGSIKPQI